MNKKINEIKKQLDSEKDCINKVDLYFLLSNEIESYDLKISYEMSQKGYKLAKDINYKKGIMNCLFRQGRAIWLMGNNNEAIPILTRTLELARKDHNYKIEVECYSTLGNVYLGLKSYHVAYNYYLRGISICDEHGLNINKGNILNNIGEVYNELESYEKALEYYLKSIKTLEKLKEIEFISIPLLNIGSIYCSQKKYCKAKKYLEDSLEIAQKYNDKIGIAYAFYEFAKIYNQSESNEKALEYYNNALKYVREAGVKNLEINILLEINSILIEKKEYSKVMSMLDKASELNKEINEESIISKIYNQYALVYEKLKEYKKSNQFFRKFIEIQNKVVIRNSEERLKSINLLNKIEQSKREKEIFRLKNVELKTKTDDLERAYNNIRIISEIGKNITSTIKLDLILDELYVKVNSIMDAYVFGIAIYDDEKEVIENKFLIENNLRLTNKTISIEDKDSFTAWCIRNKKTILINDLENEYKEYINDVNTNRIGNEVKSVIFVPLLVENSIVGVISVQSKKLNEYGENCLDIIEVLSSYIAIAIKNAQKSEKLSKEIEKKELVQKKLEKANNKLLNLSEVDGLTGVANRRKFDSFLNNVWNICRRKNTYLSLILIDIDYFKEYNDNYGHLMGDNVIKSIAIELENTMFRSSDLLARYGGDEFVAVLPDTDIKGARIVCENMIDNIKKLNIEHKFSNILDKVTITLGVICKVPDKTDTIEKFIDCADKALYEAKESGRNGFKICDE